MQDASKTRRKCLRHPGTALERARKLVYYKLPKRPIDLVIHLSHALLTPPASAPNQKAEKVTAFRERGSGKIQGGARARASCTLHLDTRDR